MNTLHSAVDLLPSFVAAVAPGAPSPAAWTGACFAVNEAAIELTPGDRNGTDVGGAVLRLKVFAQGLVTHLDAVGEAVQARVETSARELAAVVRGLQARVWRPAGRSPPSGCRPGERWGTGVGLEICS
jgi:hypothetical protein